MGNTVSHGVQKGQLTSGKMLLLAEKASFVIFRTRPLRKLYMWGAGSKAVLVVVAAMSGLKVLGLSQVGGSMS